MKTFLSHVWTFGSGSELLRHQGRGWCAPEADHQWSIGAESELTLPEITAPDGYFLEITGGPRDPGPLEIWVNQTRVALSHLSASGTFAWQMPPATGPVAILFRHPTNPQSGANQDGRPLAFSFRKIRILTPDRTRPSNVRIEEATTDSELALQFESLGDNCEFGIVQRAIGVEPLGLLRFSSAPLDRMLLGLETGFDGITDGLEAFDGIPSGLEWSMHAPNYGMRWHTFVPPTEATAAQMVERERRRLAFLVRKLLEDIESGEKVLVVRRAAPLSREEVLPLFLTLQRRGNCPLLWISEDECRAGDVEVDRPGLYHGYLSRLADPADIGGTMRLDDWLTVMRKTVALHNAGTAPERPPPPDRRPFPQPIAPRTRQISWAPSGWLISSTTDEICTDFVTVTCPDDFAAIRVGLTNIHPEPYTISKIIAAASSTLAGHTNPTGQTGWRTLSFNGGATGDPITVRGNLLERQTDHGRIPAWTWSDWLPMRSLPRRDIPGGPRVLMIRALLPKGCNHTNPNGALSEFRTTAAISRGASYVAGHVPFDAVTIPRAIDPVGACLGIANPFASCIQFLTRNEGIVGVAAGDSHAQGTSTTTQFWNYLLRSISDLNVRYGGQPPFGYWSTAEGGRTSDWFFDTMTNILDAARPGFVVLPGWTFNDRTGEVHADQTAVDIFFARLLLAAETCTRAGAVPIFLTPFPRDPGSMVAERVEAWRSLRESILALRDGGAIVLDAAAILGRRTGGVLDGTYRPEFTDDTVHPNNAGHAAIAAALTPIIEEIHQLI